MFKIIFKNLVQYKYQLSFRSILAAVKKEKKEISQKLVEDREQHRERMEAGNEVATAKLGKDQLKARFDSAKEEIDAEIEAFKRTNL